MNAGQGRRDLNNAINAGLITFGRTLSRSSGDVLADRRYAYAESLLAEDPAAAADLLEQTAERVPHWAPLWMALGTAREKQGWTAAAERAFARADTLDPDGLYGAALHLARLQGVGVAAMPAPYVAALFDDYAARFDRHLVEELGYRGPPLIRAAVLQAAGPRRFARALDLGCGTGLMGDAVRDLVDVLDGVDLSPAMLAEAERRQVYDSLEAGEIVQALATRAGASHDLVLAADVFVYVGALDDILLGVARVLRPGGLVAFSVQRSADLPVRLGADLRFAHSAAHVAAALAAAELACLSLDAVSTRRDAGVDVPGLVAVARKP